MLEEFAIGLSRSAPALPPPPQNRGQLSPRPAGHPPLGGGDCGCPDDEEEEDDDDDDDDDV